MASIQLLVQGRPFAVSLAVLFTPIPGVDDEAIALARAVQVALGTDRRALADDVLPVPPPAGQVPDRRGWWGDTNAATIWGGWPIGVRLWLMARDKITGSAAKQGATIEKARRYIAEALQPFVDAKLCSSFAIALSQTGRNKIEGTITLYRGPKSAIALQYQDFWTDLEA